MKKYLIMSILALITSTGAFARGTSIRVPLMLYGSGDFVSTALSSAPDYLYFTSNNISSQCERMTDLLEKTEEATNQEMMMYVSHPNGFEKAGKPLCYTGDANEGLQIILELSDCVLTDQFVPNRYYVKDDIVHIESTSNDDGDDLEWSSITRCE